MSNDAEFIRIITETSGIWRATKVAETIKAIEGITYRLIAASTFAELLKDYEDYFSNLKTMGLLNRGLVNNWGESPGGTDALARQDFLKCTANLRRHGILVKETPLSWQLEITFSDIIEFIPESNRLEVEYINMGSPGKMGFIMSFFKGDRKFTELLLNAVYLMFADKKTRAKLIKDYRDELKIHRDFKKAQLAHKNAETRLVNAQSMEIESRIEKHSNEITKDSDSYVQIDDQLTMDSCIVRLRDAGLSHEEINMKILIPYKKDIDYLWRLKGQGRITGLAIEFLKIPDKD